MRSIEELRSETDSMAAPALLRHLLVREFPGGCAVTAALRARSVVVLHMISDIEPATPVIFCHAAYIFPESVDYRADIVRRLGLSDIRYPDADERDGLANGDSHAEPILSEVSGGGIVRSTVRLDEALAGFACWISAAYHRGYGEDAGPRLTREGGLLRVDPLQGWTQAEVHAYLREHDLPHHPRIAVPTYHY